jgi:hypothetical protein
MIEADPALAIDQKDFATRVINPTELQRRDALEFAVKVQAKGCAAPEIYTCAMRDSIRQSMTAREHSTSPALPTIAYRRAAS